MEDSTSMVQRLKCQKPKCQRPQARNPSRAVEAVMPTGVLQGWKQSCHANRWFGPAGAKARLVSARGWLAIEFSLLFSSSSSSSA